MNIQTCSLFHTQSKIVLGDKLLFLLLLFSSLNLFSQKIYFADGYHGGIYGHYPYWQTQFMVDKLKEFPDWRINLEIEPETWDSVMVNTPEAYLQFKNIVTDPRIEFTNPMYAQTYCFNISGESIIRQFQYGIRKINQHFPEVSFYTYGVEEPCFTSSLPQLLKSFGFHNAVLKNPDTCWGGYVEGYGNDFIQWIGPDGTAISTVPRYKSEALVEKSTWQTTAWNNSTEYIQSAFQAGVQNPVGMCYQDAGWKNGPWLGYGENVKNHSTYVTWREYFSAHASEKISDVWRLSQEDIRVSLMWGSQVLQRIAQQVRHSENAIIKAEKLLSMASLETGRTLPDTIFDEAWRTLLLAQHHDSWIVPYNHLNKQRTWADEIALWTANTDKISDEIICKAQSFFVHDPVAAGSGIHALHIQPDSYLRIYNTLPKDRTEVITVKLPKEWNDKKITVLDKDGKCLPSVQQINGNEACLSCKVSVPSFGYTTLQLKEAEAGQNPPAAGITLPVPTECVMENDLYKITFDLAFGGKIKSLIAKNLGNKEFIDPNDVFGFNELRGYFYEKGQFLSNTESPAQVTILEDNALKKQIKIESKIGEHTCYQIITLNQSQERIDCSLQIDWQGNVGIGEYKQEKWEENRRAFYDDRFKLNVLFPVALSARKIYKDAPFDVCESRLENTFYNTWDSIKNTILLHWVDVMQGDGTYGFALLSDHTTTYSHGNDFPLGLTAQYSGQGLWGRDYLITQPLHIEYALIPHKGKWDDAQIATQSNGWNEPMIVSFDPVELSERSFIRFDKPGYELTSLKTDGEKQLILRIFNQESDEKPLKIKLDFPVERGEEIALNGELITTCLLEDDRNIRIAIPRFGIKTIRIHKKQ